MKIKNKETVTMTPSHTFSNACSLSHRHSSCHLSHEQRPCAFLSPPGVILLFLGCGSILDIVDSWFGSHYLVSLLCATVNFKSHFSPNWSFYDNTT